MRSLKNDIKSFGTEFITKRNIIISAAINV
jgi:hypothetical protein